MKRQSWPVMIIVVLLLLVGVATLASASTNSTNDFEVMATGLDNPRGLVFGPDGALYVAEAGEGGDGVCITGPEGEVCLGNSGAVTRVTADGQARVADDLVSLATAEGAQATGPHDVAFDAAGNLKTLVGLGADPALRDPSGPLGADGINFGQLVAIASDGSWSNQVDVAAYEASDNPDGGLIDSNPYGLLRVADGYVVADAGANALLHVTDAGVISTLAVFPDQMVEFPPGSGSMVPMQAVPTSVAVGPDGAYYVGQLTGFPFPVGGANVYRVEATGGDPEVYASGFTNVTDITFDGYGNLFVVEMFTNGLLSGDPTGAVVQIMPDDSREVLASEGLITPAGVTVGPDGMVYVTNLGTAANDGQVVRMAPAASGNFEIVAGGLNNPRGMVFGPDDGLYVAEAGAGGDGVCIVGPEGSVCLGQTGSVTRLLDGSQERVVTEMVSLGLEDTNDNATGPHDVAFDDEGVLKVLVGLGADPALRDPSGPLGADGINFGQLATVDNGSWSNEVDVSAYEASENPDDGAVDSNPYGLIQVEDGFVVADAGANALLHIDSTGTISTLAVFPDRMVEFPPGSGSMIPMQAVPTSVVVGPDGAYYVGQLTGFPFPVGGANVYRVPAEGGEPEIYASGFTNITDITFDTKGNLYVVEMFTNGILSGDPTGAIIRVAPGDSRETLASEGLVTPAGIIVSTDGEVYVTNYGTVAGLGQVVRLEAAGPTTYLVYLPAFPID